MASFCLLVQSHAPRCLQTASNLPGELVRFAGTLSEPPGCHRACIESTSTLARAQERQVVSPKAPDPLEPSDQKPKNRGAPKTPFETHLSSTSFNGPAPVTKSPMGPAAISMGDSTHRFEALSSQHPEPTTLPTLNIRCRGAAGAGPALFPSHGWGVFRLGLKGNQRNRQVFSSTNGPLTLTHNWWVNRLTPPLPSQKTTNTCK